MFPLLETIRIENAKLPLIEFHNRRFNRTRREWYGITSNLNLEEIIKIPAGSENFRYKCRVLYNDKQEQIEITPYRQRVVSSVKIVVADDVEYKYKSTYRSFLDRLFEQRGFCDDIIIVKNGMITDSWVSNLLFFDGKRWYTPDTPLLKGVQREYLLASGQIFEKSIPLSEIALYSKLRLINAMIDFERAPELDVTKDVLF